MLSRTLPVNRTVSCRTTATCSRSQRRRAVARVAAVDPHACPRWGRRSGRRARSSVDLPAPDGPVSARRSPGGDVQRDVVQRGSLAGVGEADVAQLDVALRARAGVGARALLEHLVRGQDLGHAVGAGQRGGQLARLAGEAAHRAVRLAGVADEHDQVARRERALGHAVDAGDRHERGGQRAQHPDRAVEAGLQPGDLDADAHALLAAAAHALGLVLLGAERLHDGHRATAPRWPPRRGRPRGGAGGGRGRARCGGRRS